ncbi:MAG: hypothetical protein RBR23_04195 [Arcobacteraceae bacterium]|jgi:hypothetical protein|nr:hypothetical protein [Arcobacteraceae bacterium]
MRSVVAALAVSLFGGSALVDNKQYRAQSQNAGIGSKGKVKQVKGKRSKSLKQRANRRKAKRRAA